MTGSASLLIRADGSAAIGLGHVIRCLSLAAVHVSCGGRATLLTADPLPAVSARARHAGVAVRPLCSPAGSLADAGETAAIASARGAEWTVLDGYHFDGAFQAAVSGAGSRLLVVDDHGHADRYHAQVILNHNAGADAAIYAGCEPATELLLGPRYVLLGEGFRGEPVVARAPIAPRGRRIVVTFGGSDPENVSGRVLEALALVPGPLEVTLLAGAANPHLATLERVVAQGPHPVELVVDASDMMRRLAAADLAVAAAGGTAWELARVGTPHLAIVIADNQAPAAAALARDGVVVSLGGHGPLGVESIAHAIAELVDDPVRRARMSTRGRALIDGRGAERVLAALSAHAARSAALTGAVR